MSRLLPVGSVVRLKTDIEAGKTARLIVAGYFPVDTSSNTCYQYLSASFPGGVEKDCRYFMFNNDDIGEVIFEGYSTEESSKDLDELYDKTKAALEEEPVPAAGTQDN